MRAANEAVSTARVPYEILRVGRTESPQALAWIMLLYIVVTVGRLENLTPSLMSLHLAKIVAAIAILTALRTKDTLAPTRVRSLLPAQLMFALMALATLSIFFSVLKSGTLGVIEGTVISVTVGTVLIVKSARSWADTRVLLLSFVASAIVLGVMAMRTSDNGRAGHISAYDPNDFAFVLVTLLPVIVTFAITSRGLRRLAYLCVAAWVILIVLKTESRGGLLGLLVVALIMAILLPSNRRGRFETRPTVGRTLKRLFLMAVVGALVWSVLPHRAQTRLSTITSLSEDYNANVSAGGRLTIWVDTIPLILHRPWGYGAGAFTTVDGLYGGGRYRAPHNMFLQALIELGVEGLVLFIAILVSSLRLLVRAFPKTGPPAPTAREEVERVAFVRAIIAALIGACVSGFFLSELYSQVLWILIALACVVTRPLTSSQTPPVVSASVRN